MESPDKSYAFEIAKRNIEVNAMNLKWTVGPEKAAEFLRQLAEEIDET